MVSGQDVAGAGQLTQAELQLSSEKQNILTARQQLQTEREKLTALEMSAKANRLNRARDINYQLQTGYVPRQEQIIKEQQLKTSQFLGQIEKARGELGVYEQSVLIPAESSLVQREAELGKFRTEIGARYIAQKALSGEPIPSGVSMDIMQRAKEMLGEVSGRAGLPSVDYSKGVSYDVSKIQPKTNILLENLRNLNLQSSSLTELKTFDYRTASVLQRAEHLGSYFGTQAKGFAVGLFIETPKALIEYGKALYQSPSGTLKQTALNIGTAVSHPKETLLMQKEAYLTAPGEYVGETLGTVFITKGATKGFTFAYDIGRGAKLGAMTELASKDIIAPEYFKGQPFPRISKGETAGELLKEFKPALPGETKAGGFSALNVRPLSETIKGGSELPGLYQAPKVSPAFLKLTMNEKKIFGINPLGTLNPSILRITPTRYELLFNVKESQKFVTGGFSKGHKPITSLAKAQVKFFEEKAERGVSYIPMIKTEKEAITRFETKLEFKPARYYIKFEGRRIPIYEAEALAGEPSGLTTTMNLKEFYSRYSYKSSGKPYFSTLEFSSLYSKYYKSLSSYSMKLKSSYVTPSKSKSKLYIPSLIPSKYSPGSSKLLSYSPFSIASLSSYAYSSSGKKLKAPTKLKLYQEPETRRGKVIKRKYPKQPQRYTPSFSALALGIYGKRPKKLKGGLGYDIFKVRPIVR